MDGVLDINVKVKLDVKFIDIKIGNMEFDKVLDKVISFGKS